MAFGDDIIGGPDFSAESVLDKVSRAVMPDLPENVDGDAVLNRLNRKLALGRRGAEPDFGPAEGDKKAPDFAAEGTPLDKLPDFASEGTPLPEAVPLPRARPPGAPQPPALGATGQAGAFLKGIPTGAAEGTGGILKGGAALYDNGVPAAPAAPQYDPMGNPIGTQSEPTAAIPAKPLQDRTLYKGGQAISDLAPNMSPQERDSIAGRVGMGLGGIAPYAAATVVNPLLGLGAGAVGMGMDTYGKVYEEAKNHGADDETAQRVAGRSGLVAGVLGSLPLGAGKYAESLIAKVAASSVAFATAGEAQEAILQQIAKEYDPKAGYTVDQKRIIASLILGAGMGGLHHAFERKPDEVRIDTENDTRNRRAPDDGLPPPDDGGPNPYNSRWQDNGDGTQTHYEGRDFGGGGRQDRSGPGTGAGNDGGPGPQPNSGGPGAGAGPQSGAKPGAPPPGSGPDPARAAKGDEFTFTNPDHQYGGPEDRKTAENQYVRETGKNPAKLSDAELFGQLRRAKFEKLLRTVDPKADPSKMTDGELFNTVNDHMADQAGAKPETPEEAQAREETARRRGEDAELKNKFAWMTDAQIAMMTPENREVWLGRARGKPQAGPEAASSKPQAETPKPERNASETVSETAGETDAQSAPLRTTSESDVATGTRDAPIRPKTADDVAAAKPADPTPAQAEAGNYQHAHMEFPQFGLTGSNSVSVETGLGQTRKSKVLDEAGKPLWETKMTHGAYGRDKKVIGADGDKLDYFIGPHPTSPHVFVIDQHDPETGKFDEHKVMLGYRTPIDAMHAYANSYNDGAKDRIGHVTAMGPEEFKAWRAGDTTKALKPASGEPVKAPDAGQASTEALTGQGHVPKETPTAVSGAQSDGGSDQKIQKKADRSNSPLSLLQFLANRGGLKPHPELDALDIKRTHRVQIPGKPGFHSLIRPDGDDLDTAREAAEEAGYLKGENNKTSTVRDLLDAIDEERNRGNPTAAEGETLAPTRAQKKAQAEREAAEKERHEIEYGDATRAVIDAGYVGTHTDLHEAAVKLMVNEGLSPDDAMDRAALRLLSEDPDFLRVTPNAITDTFGGGAYDEVRAGPVSANGERPARERESGARPGEGEEDRGDGEHLSPTGAARAEAKSERTEAGDQTIIPGAERIGDGELAQRKADERLKPAVAQKPADEGLFGDEKNQTDLFNTMTRRVEAQLGPDADKVAQVDISRAAEMMTENRGMDVATAFGRAVVENAVRQKFITELQARQAYGPEVEDVLESVGARPSGSGSAVEQGRAATDEGGASGTAETGVVPSSGETGSESTSSASPRAGDEAATATDTTEQQPAGRKRAARDQTGDAAENQPAAEDAGNAGDVEDDPFAPDRAALHKFKKGMEVEFIQPGEFRQADGSLKEGRLVKGVVTRVLSKEQGTVGVKENGKGDWNVRASRLTISPKDTSDGISPPVHGRDAGPESEALPSSEGQRGVGPAREPESAGGEPDVSADHGEPTGQPAGEAGSGGGSEGDDVRVSGRHADTEAGREERAVQREADAVKGENFHIEPGSLGEDRGQKVKASDNLKAIKLANRLIAEARPATAAEQHDLARYVGWGGIKNAFPDVDGNVAKGFEKIAADLKETLTPEEYETARRSIQYAHYTAEDVINGMWDIAQRLGFKGGHVFEPGMGVGHFAGLMPADVAEHTTYNGVEMDHVTARIAGLLYPKWGVRREDFTKMPLAENAFDLVIGNPPFASINIKSDPKYPQGFLLHDYFFAKSLDGVRPGGVLAFVTSAGTMNKIDRRAREYMADRADFIGGIRLPSNAFKQNAGTEVTTDILILRKRLPGEKPNGLDKVWVNTDTIELPGPDGKPVKGEVNAYFARNPEMVLGNADFADKLYEGRYSVKAPKGFDLKTELAKAIDRLPRNLMSEAETPKERAEVDFSGAEKKDGSYYVSGGKLMQQRGGAGYEVERRGKGVEGGKSAADIERIQGLVPIRDALRETFKADLADDTAAGKQARAKLNKAYDDFVGKFGPINKAEIQRRRPNAIQSEAARSEAREEARYAGQHFDEGSFDPSRMIAAGKSLTEIARARKTAIEEQGDKYRDGDFNPEEMPDVIIDKRPNIEPFIDDQESYRLRAIEHYDEPTGKAKKSDVFTKNVISKDKPPEINSVHDAVLHVLNQKGALDLDAVAGLINKSRSETIEALGDRIYQVPGTNEAWETGEKYLSGNVRKKLAVAKAAAEKNPAFRRNVAALEAAQPAPLAPSQIGASLGMPWIPPDVIEQFATEGLGLEKLKATYTPALASWTVSGDTDSMAASTTWGTARRNATALIGDALNRQSPKIYDQVDKDTRILNVTATQAAAEKMQAIRDKFNDWIFGDEKRADRLANFYNENYNNLVVQEFNGDYLTTPGISESWSWRPHQTRVIARIIQSGNTYMAHAVGAGKTSAMIGAGMEMRRLGLVKKPAYAVPNHMLAQFTKEFYEQYPTARIMVADERAFHTDRRKQFMANVALSDLDAVIMTHSSFGMIPVSDEFQDQVIEEQLDEYRHALADMPKGQDNRITRSRIEKQIERLEQRLSGKSNRKRDAVFNFDEMGIDFLFVDEAHLFRKLDFTTQMSNLKGITPQGSGASWDLYVKSKLLEKRNPGRNLVLASGTPVTNTMAELFTVSRYLQPNELRERQLDQFDAWAGAFGENVTELEQDAAGGYKPVSRFAKFVNVAELSAMVRQVMDVVTSRQLEQYVVRPKLKGGKRIMNLAEKSPALDRYQASLAARMKAMEGRGKPKPGDDIMLKVIGDGRHAAIDMRLVGADKGDAEHPSKLDLLIENVARLHKQTRAQKLYRPKNGAYDLSKPADVGPATQMIFANLGISGTRGFSVPDYVRSELVRLGVPRNEIALIADYKSHVAKQRLFNDMNEGKVRVLIGSTAKMATGVNAQRRLYAIHNLDPLWYPSDDEQRNGRGLRQGNMNPEIEIHDYSTKGTYDSTMWGMMEKKARFIQGFFEGDPSLRSMDDLGEASQYEQAKALTTNDPRLMRLTELRQELEKANRRKAAFDNERYAVRRRRADAKSDLEHYGAREIAIEKDIAQRVPLAGDAFKAKIGREAFDKRVDFGEALLKKMDAIGTKENNGRHMPIGEISGFSLVATPQFIIDHVAVHLDLKRNGGAESHITVGTSGLGAVRSMEATISGFDSDLAHVRGKIKTAEKFLAESAKDNEREFTGDADMAKLAAEIAGLQAELSAKKEEPATPAVVISEDDGVALHELDPLFDTTGTQNPSIFDGDSGLSDLTGPMKPGAVGQFDTLWNGVKTGNEHLIAYDRSGNEVFRAEGKVGYVDMSPQLVAAMNDPKNSIVVHHNHPSGGSLSDVDIGQLGRRGLQAIWAHGHNGDVFRAELTPNARTYLPIDPDYARKKLRATWLRVGDILEKPIQAAFKAGKIGPVEGNALWGDAVNGALRDAGILDYRGNYEGQGLADGIPGLDKAIEQAVELARRAVFGDAQIRNSEIAGRAWAPRHLGDVGATFDRGALNARLTRQVADRAKRATDGLAKKEGGPREVDGDQYRLLNPATAFSAPNNTFKAQGSTDVSLGEVLRTRLLGKLGELNATEAKVHLQDKFARVKNAEESVGAPTTLSAYQAESLYYGRTGQRLESLNEHHIDPIIREMKARDIDFDKMDDFLYARHAVERNINLGKGYKPGDQFYEAMTNPNIVGASGMSKRQAQDILNGIGPVKLADYKAVAAKIDALNAKTNRTLYDAGLIDRDTLDSLNITYKWYVPLRGHAEATEGMGANGSGMNVRGKEFQKAFGRRSKADSPLAYSIMQAEMAIVRAEKNKVGNTFLQFVRAHPDPQRWTVDRPPLVKRIDPTTGLVTAVPNNLYAQNDNVFTTKINGRDVHISLHGPDGLNMARALKNMGSAEINRWLRTYSVVTHTMAKLATSWNPEFMIPNLVRDIGESFINLSGESQRKFATTFVKHIPGSIRGATIAIAQGSGGGNQPPSTNPYVNAFHEFDEAGGRVRFFGIDDPDKIEDNIVKKLKRLDGGPLNTIKDIGDKASRALEIAGGGIENGTRLAAYMAARELGFSIPDAAMIGRNVSVDFNKKGELGPLISSLYMFAGAGIQGQARIIKTMGSRRAWAAIGAMAAAAALSTLMSIYEGGEDESGTTQYGKIPPWERDKNLIFMLPSKTGDNYYVKVPLPYGFSPFAVIGARSVMVAMGHEKPLKAAHAVMDSILQSFNPLGEESSLLQDIWPTALRPAAHIEANKNWTGKALYPDNPFMKGRPDSTQFFDSNSAFSKKTAKLLNEWSGGDNYKSGWIDVHPGSIDHSLQAITGGVGRFAKGLADNLYTGITAGEWHVDEMPILRRFVGKVGEKNDAAQYAEMRRSVREDNVNTAAAAKDLNAGINVEQAGKVAAKAADQQKAIFKDADDQMRDLRTQLRDIENGRSTADPAAVKAQMRNVMNAARAESTKLTKGAP